MAYDPLTGLSSAQRMLGVSDDDPFGIDMSTAQTMLRGSRARKQPRPFGVHPSLMRSPEQIKEFMQRQQEQPAPNQQPSPFGGGLLGHLSDDARAGIAPTFADSELARAISGLKVHVDPQQGAQIVSTYRPNPRAKRDEEMAQLRRARLIQRMQLARDKAAKFAETEAGIKATVDALIADWEDPNDG